MTGGRWRRIVLGDLLAGLADWLGRTNRNERTNRSERGDEARGWVAEARTARPSQNSSSLIAAFSSRIFLQWMLYIVGVCSSFKQARSERATLGAQDVLGCCPGGERSRLTSTLTALAGSGPFP